MRTRELILGIESAIGGGSLSLSQRDGEVASFRDDSNVAKAEALLVGIDAILVQANVDVRDISAIAVTAGPGSFTGIRIGIATAMGLSAGLGIELRRISILHAIASASPDTGELVSAVPLGRGMSAVQRFRKSDDALSEATSPLAVTGEEVERIRLTEKIISPDNSPTSLARCLCIASFDRRIIDTLAPIFLSKPHP